MRRIGRLLLLLDVHEELRPPPCGNRVLSGMGQHFFSVGHRLFMMPLRLGSEGSLLNVLHGFLYPHVGLGRVVHPIGGT